jgi:hypothetical protein
LQHGYVGFVPADPVRVSSLDLGNPGLMAGDFRLLAVVG